MLDGLVGDVPAVKYDVLGFPESGYEEEERNEYF